MDTTLLILFIVSLLSQQALGQDVEIRSPNEKVGAEGGGQARQRTQFSPHRMMHFGKRSETLLPMIATPPRVFDLRQPFEYQPDKYPYLLSLELEHGQQLMPVPEEFLPNNNLLYSFERLPGDLPISFGSEERRQQVSGQVQQQQQMASPRLLKLMSANNFEDSANGNLNDERAQSADGQRPQQAINVSTRSMQSNRANTLNLPKAFVSSLLYGGRQSAGSMPSFGSFNKKAEPKDNFFMHFGRK